MFSELKSTLWILVERPGRIMVHRLVFRFTENLRVSLYSHWPGEERGIFQFQLDHLPKLGLVPNQF
jgi:hypothetical protein